MNPGIASANRPPWALEHAAQSNIGMRRGNNQDAMSVVLAADVAHWQRRGHFFMVADGMGAHAAGELASKLATDTVPHHFGKSDLPIPQALKAAIEETNRVIHEKGQTSSDFQGMGTTCSCLVLHPLGAFVAHVGDSRVYRLRDGQLEQLTFDHSLVWEMAAAGKTSEESVPSYVPKNVITRSLGPNDDVVVDLEGPHEVEVGDVFILCSDGLTGPVSDSEIGTVFECLDPAEAVQTLIDLANLRGGPDNITVIAARVTDGTDSRDGHGSWATPSTARPLGVAEKTLISGGALGVAVAGWLAWQQHWLGASLAIVVGVAAIGIAAIRSWEGRASDALEGAGGRYGKGPYRRFNCQPERRVIEGLQQVVADLAKLSSEKAWQVSWDEFEQVRQDAEEAAEQDDLSQAIISYCRAIRDVMAQLRQRGRIQPSDSDILT